MMWLPTQAADVHTQAGRDAMIAVVGCKGSCQDSLIKEFANEALINTWRLRMIELLQTLAKNPPSHNLGFVRAILALAFLLWFVSCL